MIGRHIAAPRRRSPVRRLLGTTVAVGVAVVAASMAAGGTYALLSASATSASAATLTAGSASLAVTTPLALSSAPLYPGSTVVGTAVVQNTGTVPLLLQVSGLTPPASATAFSGSLTVAAAPVASTAACTAATAPAWSGTFAAAPAGALGTVPLPAGATRVVCVKVSMAASAPANAAGAAPAAFALAVRGDQTR